MSTATLEFITAFYFIFLSADTVSINCLFSNTPVNLLFLELFRMLFPRGIVVGNVVAKTGLATLLLSKAASSIPIGPRNRGLSDVTKTK